MNRKGQLGGWWEAIIFSMLLIIGFSLLVLALNDHWDKQEDPTFGISTFDDAQDVVEDLGEKTSQLEDQIGDGEFEFRDAFIVVSTVGSMIKTIIVEIISFLTGGWINDLVSLMQLPGIVATVLRIIFTAGIVFIFIRLIFKVAP